MYRAVLLIAACGLAIHQVDATACPDILSQPNSTRTATANSPDVNQDPPKCTTVGEFCYSASNVGKCYPAAACAKLDTAAGLVKTANAPDKTTDPANCTTDGEKCYNDGQSDACYAPPTTTMLTTAASSEATGSTAATGSTTASSEYTGSCVDSNTNCATWTKNGFCNSNVYTTLQKGQYCAKSCNLQPACAGGGGGGGVVTGCSDDSANCPTWTKNGFCTSSFYASQVQMCKKSCNLC
ncbi:unnamed protein product, partial [Mesorhabditis spiculigera]